MPTTPLEDLAGDRVADPEGLCGFEVTEAHIIVNALLARLSSLKRDTISLVYLQGMTISQAAKLLGVPEGTVKSQLSYGMQELGSFINTKDE